MSHEAIVVGGSFAGVTAALYLARARRRVLLIDAGMPRNRFAKHAHGVFGHDGRPPKEIIADGWRQLRAYPEATLVEAEVIEARQVEHGFVLTLADGREVSALRLILATGVKDNLPQVPGVEERWGTSVLHCPYCHGYEFGGKKLGVLANHAKAFEQALMIPDWGPTTLFTQGVFEPDAEELAKLTARRVTIERTPVAELLGPSPQLEAVRLADGRLIEIEACFTQSLVEMASPLAEQLGCRLEDGPLGCFIFLEEDKQTTVPGVYAAGDAAAPMHNGTLACASGMQAAISAHHSMMVHEDWDKG